MALIPGTLPNDTCYGTPQDLLELFAQYLDVPAFALNSKVVFGTSSAGLTADVVWFDTGSGAPASATNPIMKITVSGGFTDYIKNYITNAPGVTIVGADTLLIVDATDGNTKKGLVSDIVALAVPAAGSITPSQLSQPMTLGTAVASTSGTAIDFTSIPSWVKRLTVIFKDVGTNGASAYLIQIGSGSVTTSGYSSGGGRAGTASPLAATSTAGFIIFSAASGGGKNGIFTIALMNTSNGYVFNGTGYAPSEPNLYISAGNVTLGGVLDRVRITSVTPDTFNAGSINIMYEG